MHLLQQWIKWMKYYLYNCVALSSCFLSWQGQLYVNEPNCLITPQHFNFAWGKAFGINCLLSPPSLGGRCDTLEPIDITVNSQLNSTVKQIHSADCLNTRANISNASSRVSNVLWPWFLLTITDALWKLFTVTTVPRKLQTQGRLWLCVVSPLICPVDSKMYQSTQLLYMYSSSHISCVRHIANLYPSCRPKQ